jgi:phosphoglycolate phosphatase
MLEHLLIDHQICSKDAIYIGDRIEDMESANANQLNFIGALWGYQEEYLMSHDKLTKFFKKDLDPEIFISRINNESFK